MTVNPIMWMRKLLTGCDIAVVCGYMSSLKRTNPNGTRQRAVWRPLAPQVGATSIAIRPFYQKSVVEHVRKALEILTIRHN